MRGEVQKASARNTRRIPVDLGFCSIRHSHSSRQGLRCIFDLRFGVDQTVALCTGKPKPRIIKLVGRLNTFAATLSKMIEQGSRWDICDVEKVHHPLTIAPGYEIKRQGREVLICRDDQAPMG